MIDGGRNELTGEGSIRKRKDSRWEGFHMASYDPATGKQKIKNVLGKTQAEVKEKLKKGHYGQPAAGYEFR